MTRYQWLGLLVVAGSAAAAEPPADGWITHSDASARTPMVLSFRRDLQLERVPEKMLVSVTADNRFVLHVNGSRVASGPSTGTVRELALRGSRPGAASRRATNEITAVMWNFGEVAPASQQMVATGFRLLGDPVSTSVPVGACASTRAIRRSTARSRFPGSTTWPARPRSSTRERRRRALAGGGAGAGRRRAQAGCGSVAAADVHPAPPGIVVRSSMHGGGFPAKPILIPREHHRQTTHPARRDDLRLPGAGSAGRP